MSRKVRYKGAYVPEVERVELSEKNIRRRLVVVVLLLAIGGCALISAFNGLLSTEKGWTVIEAKASTSANGTDELYFYYNLGAGDQSATAEKKALTTLYSEMADYTYKLLDIEEEYEDVINLAYLNAHPNESVKVDPVLYDAFACLLENENRYIYLAPIYEYYNSVFFVESDLDAKEYAGELNEEIKEEYSQISAFALDSDAVSIELLGDGQVMLKVSTAYEAFMEEHALSKYINFYWLRNALVVDYMADSLIEKGYTNGELSSVDGYTRILDDSGNSECKLNLFDLVGNEIYQPADVVITQAVAVVNYRSFPLNSGDSYFYHECEDGRILSRYISLEDGSCQTSIPAIGAYSKDLDCLAIAAELSPIFVTGTFDKEAVDSLENLHPFYMQDKHIIFDETEGFELSIKTDGYSQ